jgi:hypothetical protein
MRTSATNGSIIVYKVSFGLALGWENAVKCDDVIQRAKSLNVIMRLRASRLSAGRGIHHDRRRLLPQVSSARGGGKKVTARGRRSSGVRGGRERMSVRGKLRQDDGHTFGPAVLGQSEVISRVNRYATTKIGQPKVALTIAAVSGAEERKESFVLADREKRAIAKCPARNGKVTSEHSNFTNVRLSHRF